MAIDGLAYAAVAAVVPYLVKGGEALASGTGAELWEMIKRPFKSAMEQDLVARLQVYPTAKKAQDNVWGRLEFLLESDAGLAEEIANILPAAREGAPTPDDDGN